MFIISNAQGNAHPMSNAFMGFCIDYVESSYCNLMEVVVSHLFPTHHHARHLRNWPTRRLVGRVFSFISPLLNTFIIVLSEEIPIAFNFSEISKHRSPRNMWL